MENKTKVALLGLDHQKINSVIEKINGTRPVEGFVFTDLKEFLAHCIEHSPDIVGFSVSYPHKSITQFSKVFKMVLDVKVITFCESHDPKSRKLLRAMQADFKISGLITAHNLWMKIISCLKNDSDDVSSSDGYMDDNNKLGLNKAVHLKGKQSAKYSKDKNSLLNSLLAGLGEPSSSQVENTSNIYSLKENEKTSSRDNLLGITASEDSIKTQAPPASEQATGFSSGKNLGIMMSSGSERDLAVETGYTNSWEPENDLKMNREELRKQSYKDNKGSEHKDIDNSREKDFTTNEQNEGSRLKNHDFDDKSNDYGVVKLADAAEVKAVEKEKKKKKVKKEIEKIESILIKACEKGLKEVFGSDNLEETESFKNTKLHTLIVEMTGFKGYLMVATSTQQDLENLRLKDFRSTVYEYVTNQGISMEISSEFSINETIDNFPETCEKFCEFTIHSSNKNGQHVHVSFVNREAVWPRFEDSDKENMYFVDIKVIPPHTTVNFDAYLYLPKNKKFVRYLKEGRSLSLEQAKRHTQTAANSKFYLPYEHKNNFIKFFIQNTIKWEFAIHKKTEAA